MKLRYGIISVVNTTSLNDLETIQNDIDHATKKEAYGPSSYESRMIMSCVSRRSFVSAFRRC